MAVGRAAEFYYRTGLKPTRSQMDQYVRQAGELLRQLDLPGVRRVFRKNGKVSGGVADPPPTILHEDQHTHDR
jgi:hypothetical protein